jgi:hypothetical protein
MPDPASPDPAHTDPVNDAARAALLEITPESTIGEISGRVDEGDGAVSVSFAAEMAGYPGWHWTVSVATLEGEEPSVLEVELMPGDGALLAPDWVPWSERLAEYEAAQEAVPDEFDSVEVDLDALAAADGDDSVDSEDLADDTDDDDSDDDDDDDEDDDDDDDDDDQLGSDVLHGGDLDGVDIDDLDDLDDDLDNDAESDRTY